MIGAVLAMALLMTVAAGLLRAGAAAMASTARADALHDEADGDRGAGKLADLLERRHMVIPAVNIVHTALLVAATVAGTWAVTRSFEAGPQAVAIVVLGIVLVTLGDLFPRRLGRGSSRALAYRLVPLLAAAASMGSRTATSISEPSEEENGEEDDDDQDEIELISSVLEFSETLVREVMVPRPDMVAIPATASISELMKVIDEHGYSRVPVVGEGVDDVVGLVIVKDLLPRFAAGDRPSRVSEVMRTIDFVPETKRVSDLLRDMQASKSHMAVVVDEYGGTAGLVTIEDLLEELVGEIVDEYDEDELLVEEREDGTWLVDGRLSVSELSEIVGSELPDEAWDTVGGLVLGLAGRVPHQGERFETGDVVLEVVRVQGRRVAEVDVRRHHLEGALEDAG